MNIIHDYSFNDLQQHCWSGAIDTLNRIAEEDKEEEFMNLIDEIYVSTPTITDVNDLLRFENDWIYEQLKIEEDEEEDEE